MAGSKYTYEYTSDRGNKYNVEMDESNAADVNDTLVPANTGAEVLPIADLCRYALYSNPAGTIKRKVIITTPANVPNVPLTLTVTTGTGGANPTTAILDLTAVRGEKFRLARGQDSGLTDGTP